MILFLLAAPAVFLLLLVFAHERALWERRRRASEDLRRRFPTQHGGTRL